MGGNCDVPADTGYLEPGGRAPAPEPLRLVQALVNTVDLEAGADVLDTPERLAAWLSHHHLLAGAVVADAKDLAVAIDLREGLRALALSHNAADEPEIAEGIGQLERALAQLPVQLQVSGTAIETAARAAPPVRQALAQIAVAVARAGPDQLTRLKACRRPVCRWVFYDSSRNRASTWCAMEICGARSKMETYRARHSG